MGEHQQVGIPCVSDRYQSSTALRYWQTRTHCCGHIVADTNVSPFTRARNICCGHKFCVRDTKMFLILFRNILCPQQMFPSLRAQGNIMSNNVSTTLCPHLPPPLSSGQTIATCQRNMSQHCWAQHVACVWPPCCHMLRVVGSSLKMVKFEPTTPNMSQHGGQTYATCCAQQCCDMLRWHVAIVWPGLYVLSAIHRRF